MQFQAPAGDADADGRRPRRRVARAFTRGGVTLLGRDVLALDETERARLRRREVGIVLQYGQLVPDLPVLDNVALPLLLDGGDAGAARTAAADALSRVGMDTHQHAVPAQLSGGQAQRVAVARALVTSPRVVFADEPIASLDAAGGRQVLALLIDATRAGGGALVLITHDNAAADLDNLRTPRTPPGRQSLTATVSWCGRREGHSVGSTVAQGCPGGSL